MKQTTKLAGVAIAAALLASAALAQTADKPLKVSTGKAYGSMQTSAVITDPMVDGKVLRVAVTESGQKPWLAGINSMVGEKVKAGTKVKATLWLRVSTPEPGKPAEVQVGIQDSDPPRTEWAKRKLTLTERWAPYVIEAVVPRDMAAYKISISLQVGGAKQTVDVASIGAVNAGVEPIPAT